MGGLIMFVAVAGGGEIPFWADWVGKREIF